MGNLTKFDPKYFCSFTTDDDLQSALIISILRSYEEKLKTTSEVKRTNLVINISYIKKKHAYFLVQKFSILFKIVSTSLSVARALMTLRYALTLSFVDGGGRAFEQPYPFSRAS